MTSTQACRSAENPVGKLCPENLLVTSTRIFMRLPATAVPGAVTQMVAEFFSSSKRLLRAILS